MENTLNVSGLKLAECITNTEWEIIKHFRQHYFFDQIESKDPYTWTFSHKDHKHFVLYQNGEIIGYTHIQLWSNNRAAIRIIVIDEPKRNRKYGSSFLFLCEKNLKKRGFKSIHAEANPTALAFYRKNGYTEMPFNDPENYPTDLADTAVGKML